VLRGILLAALLCACGRVGYDSADAGSAVDSSGVDAAVLGPFGAATIVSELSDPMAGDDDPTLTGDLREVYLNSSRAGGLGSGDIWVSTRSSITDPWETPTLVVELSSPDRETGPEVSADGLAIWFASDRPGGQGSSDIWVSTRPSRTMPWSAPTVVSELSSPENDTAPAPGWSQLIMTLESERPGGPGSADLFVATRPTLTSAWSTPVPMTGVNTAEHEGSPHLGPRGLTLVLNATRAGNADIHLATRGSVDDPFDASSALAELNSPDNEQDPWISEDLRRIFFVSARSGNLEIYEASR